MDEVNFFSTIKQSKLIVLTCKNLFTPSKVLALKVTACKKK